MGVTSCKLNDDNKKESNKLNEKSNISNNEDKKYNMAVTLKEMDIKDTPLYSMEIKVPYIDHLELLQKDSPKKTENTSKYSDITYDKAINWAENKDYDFYYNMKNLEEKISLNGKKISLPMEFVDFGEEFENFDRLELDDFKDKIPIAYNNSKSKMILQIFDYDELEDTFYKCSLTDRERKLIDFYVRSIDNKIKITNIYSNIIDSAQYDLRVDGIGIGNTLNEMYEKLGTPSQVVNDENGKKVYYFKNPKENANVETIVFTFNKIDEDDNYFKNNVITKVYVGM